MLETGLPQDAASLGAPHSALAVDHDVGFGIEFGNVLRELAQGNEFGSRNIADPVLVRLPDVEIAGPDVDLTSAREYGSGGLLATFTNAEQSLDQANRAKAVADLRNQAKGEVPMRLARQSARQAVERSFAMPLKAAGFSDAKVVARFPGEEAGDTSVWDVSTSYENAVAEANRREAARGQK